MGSAVVTGTVVITVSVSSAAVVSSSAGTALVFPTVSLPLLIFTASTAQQTAAAAIRTTGKALLIKSFGLSDIISPFHISGCRKNPRLVSNESYSDFDISTHSSTSLSAFSDGLHITGNFATSPDWKFSVGLSCPKI